MSAHSRARAAHKAPSAHGHGKAAPAKPRKPSRPFPWSTFRLALLVSFGVELYLHTGYGH